MLGGDVHLGSIGEFYSNAALNIPREQDHRYIPNIISSAIVNTPPAEAVSNVLSKRNKVHHLDDKCDETQIPVFETDVNGKTLNNQCLLPRRNWCSISQVPNASSGRLDVRINVEIDSSNAEGRTKPYHYAIPTLDLVQHSGGYVQQGGFNHQTPQYTQGYGSQEREQPGVAYEQVHGIEYGHSTQHIAPPLQSRPEQGIYGQAPSQNYQ